MRRAITIAACAAAHVAAAGCWGTLSYTAGDGDATSDAGDDTSPDWAGDASPDTDDDVAVPDTGVDAPPDTAWDTSPEPPPDAPPDVPPDFPPDLPVEPPPDPPPEVVPGDGTVGEPCAALADCALVPSDTAYCMNDMWGFISFPGGYCTGFCGSDAECGPGGGCDVGQCFLRCTSDAECRTSGGYTCHALPFIGPDTYCLPGG